MHKTAKSCETKPIKKIAVVHDITGFGRCGLSVVIPVLSSMGCQACPLPTAVLSTHPSGFEGFVIKDLSKKTEQIYEHWENTGIDFDCGYSGYMFSEVQLDQTAGFFRFLKENNNSLIIVDPVMGDNGNLYKIFDKAMLGKMKELCYTADVLTPNYTEACFLLGCEYSEEIKDREYVEGLVKELSSLFNTDVVVKGIPFGKGAANVAFSHGGKAEIVEYEVFPQKYPGTGDIFASVMTGCMVSGMNIYESMSFSSDFLHFIVGKTFEMETNPREGVMLETSLYRLKI